jgi:hypothetical protein
MPPRLQGEAVLQAAGSRQWLEIFQLPPPPLGAVLAIPLNIRSVCTKHDFCVAPCRTTPYGTLGNHYTLVAWCRTTWRATNFHCLCKQAHTHTSVFSSCPDGIFFACGVMGCEIESRQVMRVFFCKNAFLPVFSYP